MNSTTIEKILRSDNCTKHVFGGVYASDKLPETVDSYPKAYVANVDRSNMPGSHWVAFWFASPTHGEFFDSLGQDPEAYTLSFVTFLAKNCSKWTCNRRTLQSPFSSVFGHFCIYFIYYRCRNIATSTIEHKFTRNLVKNDELVAAFVRAIFHAIITQQIWSEDYSKVLKNHVIVNIYLVIKKN
jgi:hypothetical protein